MDTSTENNEVSTKGRATADIQVVHAEGILCIGDPHVSSRKPGTRNDVSFIETVIDKIEQAAVIANRENLQAMFLGDLFDRDREPDAYLLVRLVRALNMFYRIPFTLTGNHDMSETSLTDNTSLALLRETGVLRVVESVGIFAAVRAVDGTALLLGATPYGQTIPLDVRDDVADVCERNQIINVVRGTVWITHHDLAFDGAYPGAQELHPIKGCDLVVNGHMHLTKPVIAIEHDDGMTTWFNPGNITRQSKDCADHVPSVWAVRGVDTPAEQYPLVYVKDVFAGVAGFVDAADRSRATPTTSHFVKQLLAYNLSETARTETGSELASVMIDTFKLLKVTNEVAKEVVSLHAVVTGAEA